MPRNPKPLHVPPFRAESAAAFSVTVCSSPGAMLIALAAAVGSRVFGAPLGAEVKLCKYSVEETSPLEPADASLRIESAAETIVLPLGLSLTIPDAPVNKNIPKP